jgi:hypothetical protein
MKSIGYGTINGGKITQPGYSDNKRHMEMKTVVGVSGKKKKLTSCYHIISCQAVSLTGLGCRSQEGMIDVNERIKMEKAHG